MGNDEATEAQTPSEAAAGALRRIRTRKGWKQSDLAERLAVLGVSIDRPMISKIENGQRTVTVDEVFALAYALGVSPAVLMLPPSADANVALTPSTSVTSLDALEWLRGFWPLSQHEDRFYFDATLDAEARLHRNYPELERMRTKLAALALIDRFVVVVDEGTSRSGKGGPGKGRPLSVSENARRVLDSLQQDLDALRSTSDREGAEAFIARMKSEMQQAAKEEERER